MPEQPTIGDFITAVDKMQEAEGAAKSGDGRAWSEAINGLYKLAARARRSVKGLSHE